MLLDKVLGAPSNTKQVYSTPMAYEDGKVQVTHQIIESSTT